MRIYLGPVCTEKKLCLLFGLIAILNARADYRAEKKIHGLRPSGGLKVWEVERQGGQS